MIKALIVDDEEPARKKIETLLERHKEIRLADVAKNGSEAVEKINNFHPDLVFLDIQMPDLNGFEVIEKLKHSPFIIFTTAYDQYALKAFEVSAVDYLLKPFDEERFDRSVDIALSQIKLHATSRFEKRLMQIVNDYKHLQSEDTDVITLRERGRNIHVPIHEIQFIEANGNYLNLHTRDHTFMHRSTMADIESNVSNERFLRIHRSYIVNRDFVDRCSYQNNNEYLFVMRNGSKIISGRKFKDVIDQELF